MKGKLGPLLFALVFAIPFGGVGAFAGWGIASMFGESRRAEEWVVVQARVDEAQLLTSRGSKGGTSYQATGAYQYSFGGKEYRNTRLGFDALGGYDNIGDWQASMADYLENAKKAGKTIPVYVNPDNPAESVVDREIRWSLAIFMGIFAVVFGGVGIGALVAALFILFRRTPAESSTPARKDAARPKGSAASDAWKSAGFLWIFAFFWNAISFPIALLAVPEIIAKEEWVGLLVLLFPLIGILVLWGAINTTIGLLRRGKATLSLVPEKPHAGSSFSGGVTFPRGVRPGEAFNVNLVCNRTVEASNKQSTAPTWSKQTLAKAEQGPEGMRVAFRFEIPADVPGREEKFPGRKVSHAWRIEVAPARGSGMTNYGFDIEVHPAAGASLGFSSPDTSFGSPAPGLAFAAAGGAQPAAPSMSESTLIQLLGPEMARKLSDQQRAALSQMTPEQQAIAGNVVRNAPQIKKVVIAVVVIFFLIQIIGAIVAVIASF